MNEKDLEAKIHYFAREKYYHAMQTTALDGESRFRDNNVFKLYSGIALALGNRIQEAIRELEVLHYDIDVNIAAILTSMYSHKKCSVIDKEALVKLDVLLKENRKKASSQSLSLAALFLFYCGKYDKAREYVDRALKSNGDFVDGLNIKGWIELYAITKAVDVSVIIEYFERALNIDPNNLDSQFGIAACNKLKHKYDLSISNLNKIIVKYPFLTIALIEKMKLQFTQQDWDQALDSCSRVLSSEKNNIEALKMKALIFICHEGKHSEASTCLETIYREMEKSESRNIYLFVSTAQLFSRICGREHLILNETLKFAEKAVLLASNNAECQSTLGYQYMYKENWQDALKFFNMAAELDQLFKVQVIFCEMFENETFNSQQQLESLYESHSTRVPLVSFLMAKISKGAPNKAIAFLNDAYDIHFKQCGSLPYGENYLKKLDPDFSLLLVDEYLQYCSQPLTVIDKKMVIIGAVNIVIKHALSILETLTKACPGFNRALYLLAKVKFISGDNLAAINILNHILNDVDTSSAEAHLLLAQIYIHQRLFDKAAQILEVGVSYNFQIRENPLFYLISGIVDNRQQNFDEAIKKFMIAMDLAGINISGKANTDKKNSLPLIDKATLFLELIDAYYFSRQGEEALRVMEDAKEEFKNTTEESRIMIKYAEMAVAAKKNGLDFAITLLENVQPTDTYYLQAHTKLANLFLHEKLDRSAFTKCFREVVEHCPGPESYVVLGDAYMSIQESDRAIEAYKCALKQNPTDSELASKIGKAFIATHQYAKAIDYYKEAIKDPFNNSLMIDLAELYIKLRQNDQAEKMLVTNLDALKEQNEDLSVLFVKVKQLMLLGKVRENSGKIAAALTTLKEAKDTQNRVQRRAVIEQPSIIDDQKKILKDICVRMAELSRSLRDGEQAVQFYKEALSAVPNNSDVLIDLSKLFMQMNNLEQCEKTCAILLKSEPDNETASVMMADLAFRRVDFELAMHHFKQLLNKQPTNWVALARLIEVARRTGNLESVSEYLTTAEQDPDAAKSTGFAFCTGLYDWYCGNVNSALRQFNKARLDNEWSQQSVYNMIEICLNSEDDILGGDAFTESVENVDYRDSRTMALEMAERLHKELKPRLGGMDDEALKHRLLRNFVLLATKQKPEIERALQDFTAIASHDAFREHVGPILGLASAYTLLKQAQRARNHLKRIVKNVWTFEDAEYLERCWLLLADNYLQSNKYDMAGDLLKRVLQYNKSCVKAHEYLGYIAEKESSYKEAAVSYDNAWKYSGKSNPAIGYKLAYSYMKCKRYADAIDVCFQVLKEHPDYPKIKKDILDKSKNNLRT